MSEPYGIVPSLKSTRKILTHSCKTSEKKSKSREVFDYGKMKR